MVNSWTRSKKINNRLIALAFGFCLVGLPIRALASNNCPWLNEATASGFLDGNAVGEFKDASAGQPANCTFTQHGEGVTRTLIVTVEVAPEPHERFNSIAQACGAGSEPFKAIGNEALFCAAENRHGTSGQAIGRVRDQVFSITIRSTLKGDPIFMHDMLKSKIYAVSEQVAGNLF